LKTQLVSNFQTVSIDRIGLGTAKILEKPEKPAGLGSEQLRGQGLEIVVML